MHRKVYEYAFDVAAGTTNHEFDAVDLSHADELHFVLTLTEANTDAGDTLNVYIQSRSEDGIWHDRVAFTQLIGTLDPDTSGPETLEAVLQKFGSFSDDEEESEPSGSEGASHLTAGTVKNGPFPRPYRGSITGPGQMPGSAWRAQFVMVDADADGAFSGTLRAYAESAF